MLNDETEVELPVCVQCDSHGNAVWTKKNNAKQQSLKYTTHLQDLEEVVHVDLFRAAVNY